MVKDPPAEDSQRYCSEGYLATKTLKIRGEAIKQTIIVRLGVDLNLVGYQVGRVETNSELSDHRNVGTGRQSLHELLGTRAGNGTKVVDEIRLGETDTSIDTD